VVKRYKKEWFKLSNKNKWPKSGEKRVAKSVLKRNGFFCKSGKEIFESHLYARTMAAAISNRPAL